MLPDLDIIVMGLMQVCVTSLCQPFVILFIVAYNAFTDINNCVLLPLLR